MIQKFAEVHHSESLWSRTPSRNAIDFRRACAPEIFFSKTFTYFEGGFFAAILGDKGFVSVFID
jgi:hypothetical protein